MCNMYAVIYMYINKYSYIDIYTYVYTIILYTYNTSYLRPTIH